MASLKNVASAMVLIALVLSAVKTTEAVASITCGQVSGCLGPCITYLKGTGGPIPAPSCCSGIKSLNSLAKTTPDRQFVCNCIKATASTIKVLNWSLASGLPGKCGVKIPYKIIPSTDCNRVQ